MAFQRTIYIQDRATASGRKGHLNSGESHTDVITCFPHSSRPKRPSVWAFQEANGRKDRVDVITAKPEMSPEYMRSLSPEINKELIAELCERIIWSGGGAEASLREEDMLKEERKEDGFAEVTRPAGPRTNPTKTKFHTVHCVCICEHSQASVLTCCT